MRKISGKKKFLMVLGVWGLGLFWVHAAAVAAPEHHSSKFILDNGLTVLISEMPADSMVSVYALVKAGSATEGKYLGSGLSHCLEHMLFKGTKKRKVGEIAAQIQALGGSINASTGFDYTIYTITVPFDAFDMALDILADVLMNSSFDPAELEKEREVIIGEMRLNQDDPDRRLSEITSETIYLRHPYRYPTIGYESLFRQVSRDDLLNYYHTFYTPNNTIFSVAGHVNIEEALPKIEKAFKEFKRKNEILRNLPVEPAQISPRYFEEQYPTQLTRLSLTFQSTSLLDPDLYALDVLAQILGEGQSSRLFLEIYKKKELVRGISAYNYTPMDRGFFGIEAVLDDEKVNPAVEAILNEIEKVREKGVTKEELDKAKRQVLSGHILGRQTTSAVAYSQAADEAFTGDYQFSERYVQGVRRVQLDDIKRVAKKYLDRNRLTTVLLRPQIEKSKEKIAAAPMGDIQKIVLDNGLTVLLKEDRTFPIASMNLVMQGGVRQEPAELNGISTLTASMFLKGTKNHSADEIAEMTESRGIQLGSFSGRNSFGLRAECLSEDTARALDILTEAATQPTFPAEEIVKVKERMRTNLQLKKDDIFEAAQEALRETIFLKHPYRLDEDGTPESIERITQEDILNFYKKLVVPQNMVLSIFGDIDTQGILEKVKQTMGRLKKTDLPLASYHEDPPAQPRTKAVLLDKEQAVVMFGFQGTTIKSQDHYGLDVLSSLLGSAFSGRLFNTVREQLAAAYTLGGDSVPGIDTGLIYFYVLTTEANISSVQEILKREITKLQNENVSADELLNIKTYLKGAFKAGHETNASLNFISSLDELYGLGYQNYQDYDQAIDRVTEDEIRGLAQKYLDLNKAAIVTIRPQSQKTKNH